MTQPDYRYRNNSFASSFFVVSASASTSALTVCVPNALSMMSPTFTLTDALATFPFTSTRPASHASFATVRLLIKRDTFKNLSSLILFPFRSASSRRGCAPFTKDGQIRLTFLCAGLSAFVHGSFSSVKPSRYAKGRGNVPAFYVSQSVRRFFLIVLLFVHSVFQCFSCFELRSLAS